MPPRGKRVQDKWRMKEWYNIVSPAYFGGVNLGTTPGSDVNNLLGRIVETSLYDITGDFAQQYLKLYFKVINIVGTEAQTMFSGHEYSRDYLRSLVRRGSTRVDAILNAKTVDTYVVRLSVVIMPIGRLNAGQIAYLRKIVRDIVAEKAKNLAFDQLVQEAVLGKIASDIYNVAKKITPLRHVGVRKSKLLSYPEKPREEISVSEPILV
ncbi:30S ribosomal protein S3ae [Candidatus Bathyarchaeota archaeon]|nr:30S ribosomal protein S3ae [Candidatus Bathyarchaeota archaeon]